MRIEQVRFHSHGAVLAGTLMLPDTASAESPVAAVVQGPGWLGLRDAKLYQPYHDALSAAGIAVLVFDYRGFGDSEGDATYLDPRGQVEDYRSAATYLETRDDVDARRLGAFGSGGTGGGNAIMAAGIDARFKAMVSQVPIADGRDWLHRMRREHEWLEFLERLRVDRLERSRSGVGELVAPRDGIMVPTPERKATTIKADVDQRVPSQVALASAEAIFEYRPIDVVGDIAPRAAMFICVEHDATTPEDHSYDLYDAAGAPKRLVVQTGTTHYAAYEQYRDIVAPLIAEWFVTHLVDGDVHVHEAPAEASVTYLRRS
ncbi:MAG TPA: alpha/beta hydrolase [Candidatus Limnocylindrales bacterium]|jgi:dipeptidyl aminopeptidase/acylaminoacyl peptidase|nr:alpha/beta hydrolase [Candidatus Limnocylindrales bacterium]